MAALRFRFLVGLKVEEDGDVALCFIMNEGCLI